MLIENIVFILHICTFLKESVRDLPHKGHTKAEKIYRFNVK
jgi:hypothetical protein